MTDTEIRIACAEACGFEFRKIKRLCIEVWRQPGCRYLGKKAGTDDFTMGLCLEEYIPKYSSDLNDIAAAVSTLSDEELASWFNHLCDIVKRDTKREPGLNALFLCDVANATARQRSEAFLRAKGLWRQERSE